MDLLIILLLIIGFIIFMIFFASLFIIFLGMLAAFHHIDDMIEKHEHGWAK
jgi:hypothetical protein